MMAKGTEDGKKLTGDNTEHLMELFGTSLPALNRSPEMCSPVFA